jgi:biopolymer transport protein TolR
MPKLEALDQALRRGGGRRARGGRVSSSLAEINVVPLIDVMLVLLVIFMVTAPMMQQGFPVQLPESRRSVPIDQQPVSVSVPANYPTSRQVYLGDEAIPVMALTTRIQQELEGRVQRGVTVSADGTLPYQHLIDIMDELRAAGVVNVGLQAQPPRGRRAP